jgi:hypothetical protein
MPNEPTPPPPPPVASPRAAFLQRAAPIIARERGLTPRARVLLTSLASDMELPAAEFDEAMAILQSGELLAAKAEDPQRTRFRGFLKRQLEELKAGILSARHEQTLMHFAVSQLGMAEDAAREDLLTVAGEAGLRRVPLEEALRYVEELVAQKIGDETMVDSSDVKRLHHLSRDWGLEPADVDDLVRYRLEDNVARQRRDRLWSRGVIGGGIGVVVLVVLIFAAVAWRNWGGSGNSQEASADPEVTSPGPESEPRRTKPPAWWDADLTIAISQARHEREGFAAVYDALIADDPQRRGQGYELLLDHAASSPFDIRNWKLHEGVLIGCYALDPDDAAADKLRRQWLAVSQRVVDAVPPSADEYQAAIRPLMSTVKAIKDPRTPEPRRQAMSDELGRMLHAPLNSSAPDDELLRESLGALAVVLLDRLAEAVEMRPDVLSGHYRVLAALARDRTSLEEMAKLDATIAAAAIEHSADNWRSWETILHRGIESRDGLAIRRIVEAYERCSSSELRKELEKRLFARLGISPAGLPSSRYADAMRKALGASLPADASDADRWVRLAPRAADALEESRRAASDPAASLKSTANLAWNVNLAMALALPRPNPGQFDRWLADGPPWERKTDEEEPTGASPAFGGGDRLTRDQQDTFDRYLHELGEWQKLDEPRRGSYLRAIGQAASKVSDLSPIQARHLASYLLGRKGEEEQAFVLDNATLLRWRQLRIALADSIERSQLPPDHLRRLVIIFSGHEVLDIDKNRGAARRALLKSVVDELSTAPAGTAAREASSDVDRWAGELAAVYRQRAQLMGVGPSDLESLSSASALLRLAVARLSPSTSHEANDTASRLFTAADALGASDAQRCVVLQRSAIERTAAEIQRRQPDRRQETRKLLDQFQKKIAASKQVLAQLQEGEATLLELWLLARPK